MSFSAAAARGLAASLGALWLAACAPVGPAIMVVETTSPHAVPRPMIEVRHGNGAAFQREDWMLAETHARAYCAERGMAYQRLPASGDYTQIRLDGGVFAFMARCRPLPEGPQPAGA